MRTILQLIAGTVIGVFLLVIGIGLLANDGAPDCGGRKMSRDDTCVTTKRGKSTTRTYDQQKSSDRGAGIGMVVVGGLMALGSGGFLVTGVVGSRRNKNAAGVAAYPAATDPQAYGQHRICAAAQLRRPTRSGSAGLRTAAGLPRARRFHPAAGLRAAARTVPGLRCAARVRPATWRPAAIRAAEWPAASAGPFSPHTRGQ